MARTNNVGVSSARAIRRERASLMSEPAGYRRLPHLLHTCYITVMTTAEDIEKAVEQLAPRELARFRAWFEAFESERFDAAITRDAEAGKLDDLAAEALAAHRAGRSREL